MKTLIFACIMFLVVPVFAGDWCCKNNDCNNSLFPGAAGAAAEIMKYNAERKRQELPRLGSSLRELGSSLRGLGSSIQGLKQGMTAREVEKVAGMLLKWPDKSEAGLREFRRQNPNISTDVFLQAVRIYADYMRDLRSINR